MRPYYDHKGITIYHGDCLEILPHLEPVDLVLTDPPYGSTAHKWDNRIPIERMWEEIMRIIKSCSPILLTASQPFSSILISSNLKMFRYEWIWDKIGGANFMNLRNGPFKIHEHVLVFSKNSNFPFNPIRVSRSKKSLDRDPPGKTAVRKMNGTAEHYNMRRNKILKLNKDGKRHPVSIISFSVREKGRYLIKHGTKKPVKLFDYLIKTYSNDGDLILDFAMGSGTTLVAAKELGRKAIGIDIDENCCKTAVRRLSQDVLPFRQPAVSAD